MGDLVQSTRKATGAKRALTSDASNLTEEVASDTPEAHGMWDSTDAVTPAPVLQKVKRAINKIKTMGIMQKLKMKGKSDTGVTDGAEEAQCAREEMCSDSELDELSPSVVPGIRLPHFADLVAAGEASYSSRPPATDADGNSVGDGPVNVFVTCLVKDIGDVDIVNGTFFLNLGMKVFWRDPRMKNWQGRLPEDLWCPNVMLPNSNDIPEESLYHHQATDGVVLQHPASGLLVFHRNTLGHFSSPFNLKTFPFDENSLRVRFNASKLRDGSTCTADDVLLWAGTSAGAGMRSGPFILVAQNVQEHMPEFEIVGTFSDSYVQGRCSFITWGVSVRRFTNFYMFKMIIFLWVALPMAGTVYMLPESELAVRVDILFDCLAVLLAFLFVINDKLPRTPYLHKLDWLILMSLLFVFVTCVCSWIAYWISTAYGDDTADLFNKVCTGVLVLVWVASNVSLFVVQYVQYLLADAQTRPSYLQDSAADWIPFDEVVKIDLWASAGKRQTKGTSY